MIFFYPFLKFLILLILFFRKPHSLNASKSDFTRILLPLIQHLRPWDYARNTRNTRNETIIEPYQILDTNTQICPGYFTNDFSSDQLQQIQNASFWIEGIFKFLIGSIGLISNLIAIPILCSKQMKSIFNKLLISLLILNTMYIIVTFFTGIVSPEWKDNQPKMTKEWFCILFTVVLYPLQLFVMHASTFTTMLMARQRCMAIKDPIEYHNSTVGENPWRAAVKNLTIASLASCLITFPVYFEISVSYTQVPAIRNINETHLQYVSIQSIFDICTIYLS